MEDVKKAELQICYDAQNLNEEQESIILQTRTHGGFFTKYWLENDGDYFTQNEERRIHNFHWIWVLGW